MLSLLGLTLMVIGLFKLTGIVLRLTGKVLGGILGLIGWLALGAVAITIFGFAIYILPLLLVIGVAAIVAAA